MDRSDCLFGRRGGQTAAEPAKRVASAGDGCGRAVTAAPGSHVAMPLRETPNLGALTKDLVRWMQLIPICAQTGAGCCKWLSDVVFFLNPSAAVDHLSYHHPACTSSVTLSSAHQHSLHHRRWTASQWPCIRHSGTSRFLNGFIRG